MARDLTTEIAAQFSSQHLAPVFLVDLQFASGWIYLWSGVGAVVWNGNTYLGVALPDGQVLGGISSLVESTDVQAQAAVLSLRGIPASAVQQVLAECRQSYLARIYVGALDLNTGAILPDPFRAWGGTTDVPTITDDGATCTVALTVESRLVDLQRTREWRYTHEDQQLFSPGDLGFIYVAALQDISITWGKGSPVAPVGQPTIPTG
jgi:hypothetical protein